MGVWAPVDYLSRLATWDKLQRCAGTPGPVLAPALYAGNPHWIRNEGRGREKVDELDASDLVNSHMRTDAAAMGVPR